MNIKMFAMVIPQSYSKEEREIVMEIAILVVTPKLISSATT
jgi:hypothetical protein